MGCDLPSGFPKSTKVSCGMPNHCLIYRLRNVCKLHLLRRLLLPLLDDLLNAADEEPIYVVSPTVWKQSNQRSS